MAGLSETSLRPKVHPRTAHGRRRTRCSMAARIRRTERISSSLKPITRMASVTAWWWLLSSLSEAWGRRGSALQRVLRHGTPHTPCPIPCTESLLNRGALLVPLGTQHA